MCNTFLGSLGVANWVQPVCILHQECPNLSAKVSERGFLISRISKQHRALRNRKKAREFIECVKISKDSYLECRGNFYSDNQ